MIEILGGGAISTTVKARRGLGIRGIRTGQGGEEVRSMFSVLSRAIGFLYFDGSACFSWPPALAPTEAQNREFELRLCALAVLLTWFPI